MLSSTRRIQLLVRPWVATFIAAAIAQPCGSTFAQQPAPGALQKASQASPAKKSPDSNAVRERKLEQAAKLLEAQEQLLDVLQEIASGSWPPKKHQESDADRQRKLEEAVELLEARIAVWEARLTVVKLRYLELFTQLGQSNRVEERLACLERRSALIDAMVGATRAELHLHRIKSGQFIDSFYPPGPTRQNLLNELERRLDPPNRHIEAARRNFACES
jgi:hypothetical protein